MEDNPKFSRRLQAYLAEVGPIKFDVAHAEQLSGGLQLVHDETFDVIVLDLNLPDSRGLDTIARMNREARDVPIIVLTGADDEETAILALREGAQDYLVKSQVDGDVLLRSVRYAIERKKSEAALRESETHVRDILEHISDSVVTIDQAGRIESFNAAAERAFGYAASEVVGRNVAMLMPEPDRSRHDGYIGRYLDTGKGKILGIGPREVMGRCKDGSTFPLELAITEMFLGEKRMLIGAMRDITERKRTEETLRKSDERLRDAIESLQEGFVLFDADDRLLAVNDMYRRVNPAAQEIFEKGGTFEDLIRANVARGVIVEAQDREEEFIRERIARHRDPKGPVVHRYTDGTWCMFREVRTPEGGVALTVTDITEIKRAEQALRESQARAAKAERRLLDAVESLAASFILYDADERLVLCNSTAREFLPDVAELLVPGTRFEDLVRARLERTMPAAAAGQIEERVRERVENFRRPGSAIEEHHDDGRWTQAWERRTADGGTVCIRTEITEIKKAEEKLHILSSAVEQSPAAVTITDTDGAIEYVNPAFTAITGYTREDVIGHNPRMLQSGQTPEATYESLWATVTAGKVWRGTLHNKRKDDTPYLAGISISPITTSDGTIIHLLGTHQDITERKRAEVALRVGMSQIEAMVQNMFECVITFDRAARIESLNAAAEAAFGYTASEVVGRHVALLMPDPDSSDDEDYVQMYLRAGKVKNPVPREVTGRRKGGSTFPLEIAVTDMYLGAKRVYIGCLRDITDRKRVEKELAKYRDNLEKLVEERSAELRHQAKRLATALEKEREYNQLQRQFVSMASHEFRTPLAIIDGAAQRIIRRNYKMTAIELDAKAEKIRSAVGRMTGLIDSTLSTARLDAGKIKLNPEPCDLAKLIETVCERQAGISKSHDISVDVSGLAADGIIADPELLDQVFTNLVSNAVKYSPDDSRIEVRGWSAGEHVVVSVRDHGLGIPAAELPQLFTPFFRATTSTGIAGTGIGLHLVKQLVEMHRGHVELESVEGKGSTFTVCLHTDLLGRVDSERPSPGDDQARDISSPDGEITFVQSA